MNRKLRNKISDMLLMREIKNSSRKTEMVSFDQARSIGILYDATDDSSYELIKNYVKDVRGLSKEVLALGFYDKKELPNTRFMKLGLDFFTRKSLNWKMKPNHPIVNNFINKNFDILICLNLNKSIPLRYISALTKAKFKIGKYDSGTSTIYDFMISMDGQATLKQMIEHVNHYLKLIRNDQYQEA